MKIDSNVELPVPFATTRKPGERRGRKVKDGRLEPLVEATPQSNAPASLPQRQETPPPPVVARLPLPKELEALRRYAATGSLAAVAREMGIPVYEVRRLAKTDWWQQELAELRRDEMALSNAALTRIFDATLAQLEDRIEHGDEVMTMTGETRNVPLKADTLVRIASVVFDKRQLLRNLPTQIEAGQGKLSQIAEKLRALGAKDPSLVLDVQEKDDA